MWSYYGSKTKIAALYPKPKYHKIYEPFAGTAKYSLLYFDNDVTLIDAYEPIVKIWHWLQSCSKKDILSLPILKKGESIKDIKFDCEGQALFMGYMVGRGLSRPQFKVSPFVASEKQYHFEFSYKRIAADLFKIKHWKIIHADYASIKNDKCTWFVDPPYQFGGERYPCNEIDFLSLGRWCRSRSGQVIVCENMKANWMEFNPLKRIQGSLYKSTEAIWTNYHTQLQNTQIELF
jgi:hypothetical protein